MQLRQRRLGIAAARGIDEILQRRLGRVADNRLDVFVTDAPSAMRVERKLDNLRPRQCLVGAEPCHQIVARLAIDGESGFGQLRVDQSRQRAVVGVAGQRRRGLVSLEQFAQAGVRPEVAGFDDQGIVELRREQCLERWHVELGPGGHSDHAPRGKHRSGLELDFEPRRILAKIAVVEPHDLGRSLAAAGKELSERARAFGHQTGVRPVDQYGAALRLRRLQKAGNG